MVWLIYSTSCVPTPDPYIPRAKRPPRYLAPFLSWINKNIDRLADNLAPLISVRRTSTPCFVCPHFSPRYQDQDQDLHQCFKHLQSLIPQCFHSFCCHLWHYLFYHWKFSWWQAQHRPPHPFAAFSAINAGVARAHAAAPSSQSSPRVLFDSDSLDILGDGGATSCISNSLSDFITPPQNSTV